MPHTHHLLAVAIVAAQAAAGAAPPANPSTGDTGVPALYATRAEAEKAAKLHFRCTGAHKMGNHWMPCTQHGAGQQAPH